MSSDAQGLLDVSKYTTQTKALKTHYPWVTSAADASWMTSRKPQVGHHGVYGIEHVCHGEAIRNSIAAFLRRRACRLEENLHHRRFSHAHEECLDLVGWDLVGVLHEQIFLFDIGNTTAEYRSVLKKQ